VDHIKLVFGRFDQIFSGTSINLKKSIMISYIKSTVFYKTYFPRLLVPAMLADNHKGIPVKNYLWGWN